MKKRAQIAFVKAEANGNDFLLVEAASLPRAAWADFARAACDRHRGIGADGVELTGPLERMAGQTALELTLLNADGSEAEISGNGSRCVAAWAAWRHGARVLTLRTAAGAIHAHVNGSDDDGLAIAIEMGVPRFAGAGEAGASTAERGAPPGDFEVDIDGQRLRYIALSMGNPHCCIFFEDFPADWERLGARIESDPRFPGHTNVEFVRVAARNRLELRIFERGVGPTQSSGTGSCAAAVAAIASGRAASPVDVISPGGSQRVTWAGERKGVLLEGPARIVASGTFVAVRA